MNSVFRIILSKLPRTKSFLKKMRSLFSSSFGISSNYVELNSFEINAESSRLRSAWKSIELPQRQRELVDKQLVAYKSGLPLDVFDVMVEAMQEVLNGPQKMSVLEVGCSSGYYSEVFEFTGIDVKYTGCDYSEAFIKLARQRYPTLHFDVEDATSLTYGHETFDVVVSGCCLLHIPEYETAVAETARVARQYVIFHRTPIVVGQKNKYYRKQAYGLETVEIHFNEQEFLELLHVHGLELMKTWTLTEEVNSEGSSAVRTYLCRKLQIKLDSLVVYN